MPTEPDTPEQLTEATRVATTLVEDAVEHLRAARDALDEASELDSLPPGVATGLREYEALVNAMRSVLKATCEWDDDKAEGLWLEQSEETILAAIRAYLEPTPEWPESMAKPERHLSEQSEDDQARG
jgi:hypothetical protein